ncbi:hypothetical protein T440DRAFT_468615 [Plenodomus tracheiphilus IPT5]|uniref:RanBP2-type domain-containing protein n=1 Tax=Plenodomus tracheiphilus IPT5 TaxID=1408161 RepID=A0A6A7B7L3_9PLEO|nr:hypothetical protein T440DRAFT_468615 [Plenodomus tracheiphilus IPT5]
MTDNHIVKTFRTRLSASDPHTKHLLQKQLYLLGSARQSDILRDESVQPGMIKLVKSTKSTKSTNSGSKGKTRAYDPRCCLGATCPSCFRRGMPPDMWFCRECGMCNLGEIMPTRCPICGCERQL